MPRLLDRDDHRFPEKPAEVVQDGPQALDDVGPTRVAETHDQDLSDPSTRRGSDLAKVEIEGDHAALLGECLGEDLAVWKALQSLLAQMHDLMTVLA